MIAGPIRRTRERQRISDCDVARFEKGSRTMISLVENQAVQAELLTDKGKLRQQVELAISKTPAIDVHTHVHPHEFNGLFLSGIDDLLTYHYLIAEPLRSTELTHATFWRMT